MNDINMIFGAPGCGKTTYLINLLQDLLKEHEPDKIAFVSFTKKGSYEGRDRAIEKFNFKEEDFPYFRTIHSIAFRQLGMSRYDMISRKHYKDFSKAMGMNFLGYYTQDLINNDDKYLFYTSLKKNNPAKAEQALMNLNTRTVELVSKSYERYKLAARVKDFDDLLLDFIEQGKPLNVDIAIIDEAQDLTTLQWEFCRVAFKNCSHVYIAGDDDQAIYEWSGADLKQFLALTHNSRIKILDKSYRLRSNVLEFSKGISSQIRNRVEKVFDPVAEGGNIYFYNSLEEVTINSEESYYFLSRNNYFLGSIKRYLMSKGLLFYFKEGLSVNLNTYNAIRLHESYRKNYPDVAHRKEIVRELLRKDITNLDVPWFEAFNIEAEEENYFRDLFKNKTDFNRCNLTVSTIHGVKGGEADNVIVLLDMTKSVHEAYEGSQESIESELRCLYVALTRAKKNLHIVYSEGKFGYDNIINHCRRI